MATETATPGRLAGRVAIVTGAGMGIGRSIARRLAMEGAAVTLASRTLARVEALAEELAAAGATALPLACDVTERGQIEAAVAATVERLGPPDILVNNAQGAQHTRGPLIEMTDDEGMATYRGGPLASLAAMQACFPHMRDRGGSVVNVASTTGVGGAPGFAAYAMAKEAIRGLTKVAAREWGKYGITVNVICPAALTDGSRGYFADNPGAEQRVAQGTPLGRMGDPDDDIAPVVLGLVTDFRYVTGATIMVDGGAHILH